jgi:hypothetical protein
LVKFQLKIFLYPIEKITKAWLLDVQ